MSFCFLAIVCIAVRNIFEQVFVWLCMPNHFNHVQLCDPTDCSLPGSSVHGIFLARVLEWVAITFPRGSSRPRDQTRVSRIAGRVFTIWATKQTLPVGKKRSRGKLKYLAQTTAYLYLEPWTNIVKVLFDASLQSRRTCIWGRMVNQIISGWRPTLIEHLLHAVYFV